MVTEPLDEESQDESQTRRSFMQAGAVIATGVAALSLASEVGGQELPSKIPSSPHLSGLKMFAPTAERSVFKNFADLRGNAREAIDLAGEIVNRLPDRERVVLVMTKAEFGRISVPLNMVAAEVIS